MATPVRGDPVSVGELFRPQPRRARHRRLRSPRRGWRRRQGRPARRRLRTRELPPPAARPPLITPRRPRTPSKRQSWTPPASGSFSRVGAASSSTPSCARRSICCAPRYDSGEALVRPRSPRMRPEIALPRSGFPHPGNGRQVYPLDAAPERHVSGETPAVRSRSDSSRKAGNRFAQGLTVQNRPPHRDHQPVHTVFGRHDAESKGGSSGEGKRRTCVPVDERRCAADREWKVRSRSRRRHGSRRTRSFLALGGSISGTLPASASAPDAVAPGVGPSAPFAVLPSRGARSSIHSPSTLDRR